MKKFYGAVIAVTAVALFCVGILILNPHSDPTSNAYITHPVIIALGFAIAAAFFALAVYGLVFMPIRYFYRKFFKKDTPPPKDEYVSKWDE